jgi:hypothetical protein
VDAGKHYYVVIVPTTADDATSSPNTKLHAPTSLPALVLKSYFCNALVTAFGCGYCALYACALAFDFLIFFFLQYTFDNEIVDNLIVRCDEED